MFGEYKSNYDSSGYDGYGGGGGGGFLSSSQQVGDSVGGSSSSAFAAQKGKRDPQTLLPVTIRQLLTADYRDDKFRIDGRDVAQISLVVQVIAIDVKSTYVAYVVTDGTGDINVRVHIGGPTDVTTQDHGIVDVPNNSYIRLIGALKMMGSGDGQRVITGYHISIVKDYNQITSHFLECIYAHLRNTKGPIQTTSRNGAASSTHHNTPAATHTATHNNPHTRDYGATAPLSSMMPHQNPPGGLSHMPGGGGLHSNYPMNNSLSALQNQILAVFATNRSETGAGIHEVAALVGQNVLQVKKHVELLCEEGLLYSTIDDEHFKSTES